MNRKVYFILFGIMAMLWIGYLIDRFGTTASSTTQDLSAARPVGPRNGPVKTYDDHGKLKTLVHYKNGQKDGTSVLYYPDGETVQLTMPYADGKREGTSKKYDANGALYAETPYRDDQLHGERKTYYRNGYLKSVASYGYGLPGVGLMEYVSSGNQKELPQVTYKYSNGQIKLELSKACEKVRFHLGRLVEDRFFDELSRELKALPERGSTSFIDLKVYSAEYLKTQDIVCVCKSSQGNTLVLKKRIDTSSLKNVN